MINVFKWYRDYKAEQLKIREAHRRLMRARWSAPSSDIHKFINDVQKRQKHLSSNFNVIDGGNK